MLRGKIVDENGKEIRKGDVDIVSLVVPAKEEKEGMEGTLSINPVKTTTATAEAIYFKPMHPYTINVDNINNMNDVRHIIRLLDIRLTEERARDLPLHLVKRTEDK